MKPGKPPPPESRLPHSLAGMAKAESANEHHSGFEKVTMTFVDEFAPSVAKFSTTAPAATDSALARHFFYNQQIHVTLANAIERAVELGFPRVDYNFSLGFVPVSSENFRMVSQFGHSICPTLGEGSEDWLCVQCYLRWIGACWTFTEGPTTPPEPTDMTSSMTETQIAFRNRSMEFQCVADAMLLLGAAIRELELHRLNRKDALRGKKTVRSAKEGAAARRGALAPDTESRLREMARLVPKHGVKGAAEALFRKNIGTSANANRALWNRHRISNVGTDPANVTR